MAVIFFFFFHFYQVGTIFKIIFLTIKLKQYKDGKLYLSINANVTFNQKGLLRLLPHKQICFCYGGVCGRSPSHLSPPEVH